MTRRYLLIFACLILLIAAFATLNKWLMETRYQEISDLLASIELDRDVQNNYALFNHYILLKKRIHAGDSYPDNLIIDKAKLAAIDNSVLETPQSHRIDMTRSVLNRLRKFLGQKPILPISRLPEYAILEHAYTLERMGRYSQALASYNQLLESTQPSGILKDVILIHKAFCLSMVEHKELARELFRYVHNSTSSTEMASIARNLEELLADIEEQGSILETASVTPLQKARAAFNSLDYFRAIEASKAIIDTSRILCTGSEAAYLLAESYEAIGEIGLAIKTYLSVEDVPHCSQWRIRAQKKLYTLKVLNKPLLDIFQEQVESDQDTATAQAISMLLESDSIETELKSTDHSFTESIGNIRSLTEQDQSDTGTQTKIMEVLRSQLTHTTTAILTSQDSVLYDVVKSRGNAVHATDQESIERLLLKAIDQKLDDLDKNEIMRMRKEREAVDAQTVHLNESTARISSKIASWYDSVSCYPKYPRDIQISLECDLAEDGHVEEIAFKNDVSLSNSVINELFAYTATHRFSDIPIHHTLRKITMPLHLKSHRRCLVEISLPHDTSQHTPTIIAQPHSSETIVVKTDTIIKSVQEISRQSKIDSTPLVATTKLPEAMKPLAVPDCTQASHTIPTEDRSSSNKRKSLIMKAGGALLLSAALIGGYLLILLNSPTTPEPGSDDAIPPPPSLPESNLTPAGGGG